MSILINAIFDYQPLSQETATTFEETVATALPALRELKEYLMRRGSSDDGFDSWTKQETKLSYRPFCIDGPGGIHLQITPHLVWLHAAGRWSGFMSIADLRQAHLKAIRAVAKSLSASFIAYFADCDDVYNFIYENQPANKIGEVLVNRFGEARIDVDVVDPVAAKLRPTVWYY